MSDSAASPTSELLDCRHITRAAGLALDPGKLLLGGMALVVLDFGLIAIQRLPFAEQSLSLVLTQPVHFGESALADLIEMGFGVLLAPLRSVIVPGIAIFRSGSSWPELATAWTQLLWALVVWSVFGGAIARMAAVQFAKRERIGIRNGLRFSVRQLQNYLTAPFLPLAGVGCLLAFNAVLGAIASLMPAVGDIVLGLIWGLVLFCGLLMALLLVCVAVGWPLQIAAVSTEDSDGFDGLGRANGFLLDRAWLALLLTFLSLLVFACGWLLISTLTYLAVYMAEWAIAAGQTEQAARWPSLFRSTEPTSLKDYWLELPRLLLRGYGPSFFWCGITVIYFLLRKSEDGTPLDDVTVRVDAVAVASAAEAESSASDEPAS
ncbi:MAG: hypothetical protein ACYTGL_22385 [Planctomycetota bacterium]|jgi:hypothetical protein